MTTARPAHETRRVSSGDTDIHYRLFGGGGGLPVIIAHGLSFFSWDWIEIAEALASERPVAAMDMRGFGESGWSPYHKYAPPAAAADIMAIMDQEGWDRAILAGHSFGGRVCLYATATWPDRVAALALIDFAPDLAPLGRKRVAQSIGGQPDLFDGVEAAMRYDGLDPAQAGADLRKRYEMFLQPVDGGYRLKRDLYHRDKFKAVLETGQRAPEKTDFWALLSNLTQPLTVIRAAESDLFAPETMDKVRQANSRAEVLEIAGTHDLARTNPEGLVDALRPLIARAE